MASNVIYEGVASTAHPADGLFAGKKFWLSRQIPQRSRFITDIEANGGEVVPLEKQADIQLADHARKNAAPNTYSYKYIELSVRNCSLEELENHTLGEPSRASRPVGSIVTAPKGSRNPFTEADDQTLWDWVKPLADLGGAISGNEIYKSLERQNPRHTYQSWRDRWIKYVSKRDMQIQHRPHDEEGGMLLGSPVRPADGEGQGVEGSLHALTEAPPRRSPVRRIQDRSARHQHTSITQQAESEGHAAATPAALEARSIPTGKNPFTEEEGKLLLEAAESILQTPAKSVDDSWQRMCEEKPTHTAEDWKAYFHATIAPIYEGQKRRKKVQREREAALAAQLADKSLHRRETTNHNHSGRFISLSPSPSEKSAPNRSQSFRPESPELQERAPEPNEARKRSSAKGTNSQESNEASLQSQVDGLVDNKSPNKTEMQSPKRKRRSHNEADDEQPFESLLPRSDQGRFKRRKQNEHNQRLEIPSTPDHDRRREQEEADSMVDKGTPTPRARRSPQNRLSSPLFVPQHANSVNARWSQEPGDVGSSPPIELPARRLPLTPKRHSDQEPEAHTSPLSVRLVSDRDPQAPSSPQYEGEEEVSPTPDFNTPLEVSQVFETAPSAPRPETQALFHEKDQTEQDDDFALPEPPGGWDEPLVPVRTAPDAARPETQVLFQQRDRMEQDDEFALPEPPGGWDELPLPIENAKGEAGVQGAEVGEDEVDDNDDSSTAANLDEWIAIHKEKDADADEELLLNAFERTNNDTSKANFVYQHLLKGKNAPQNVPGVWTVEEDEIIEGSDSREIARIGKKHGDDEMIIRLRWLEKLR